MTYNKGDTPPWTNAQYEQIIGRLDRKGQKRKDIRARYTHERSKKFLQRLGLNAKMKWIAYHRRYKQLKRRYEQNID